MAPKTKHVITLKDIANDTGFSINTVSRVLNNKDNIADKSREQILRSAQKLGYVKNSLAGSLRSGSSGTIAIIISDVSNPIFGSLVKEIDALLRMKNYCAFILNTNEEKDLEQNAVYVAIGKKVDGVILCPNQQSRASIDLLVANDVPYVLMGRHFDNQEDDTVVWDDRRGGYLATTHLIRKGRKDILFLNGPEYISSSKERLMGYKKALSENGIPFDDRLVKECPIISSNILSLISKQLCDGPKFNALFAFNDLIALESVLALQQLGFRVPEDIAVIGFDNIQSRLPMPMQLTTINIPITETAQQVVNLLISQIRGDEQATPKHIVLDTDLVVRQST